MCVCVSVCVCVRAFSYVSSMESFLQLKDWKERCLHGTCTVLVESRDFEELEQSTNTSVVFVVHHVNGCTILTSLVLEECTCPLKAITTVNSGGILMRCVPCFVSEQSVVAGLCVFCPQYP